MITAWSPRFQHHLKLSLDVKMSTAPSFHSTWTHFSDDLELTFPELKASLDVLRSQGNDERLKGFRSVWKSRLSVIATKDVGIFETAEGGDCGKR
jgi:hypothetical protein